MLALLTGCILAAGSPAAPLQVVGREADGLQAALGAYGVAWEWAELPSALEGGAAAHLQNQSYPEPTLLTLDQARSLEQLVASGGRLYLEFATPAGGGSLFGIDLPGTAKRARHQRLVVREDLGSELSAGDILEEHNSACLVPGGLPGGAQVLLDYATVIGTYHVVEEAPSFQVAVDLGEPRSITSVSQRYGAGQPNYLPESVELWLGDDPTQMRRVGRTGDLPDPIARFDVEAKARHVRLVCEKLKRSPVTDFLFMGEIEIIDDTGANVALHHPYVLHPAVGDGEYGDDGRKLTDGVIDGSYADGLSVGWLTKDAETWNGWPALIEVPYGEGAALIALTKLSDFRAREYRLTRRWEALMRSIALWLAPPGDREAVERHYVPLRCWAEPRVWCPSGSAATLRIETDETATVTATFGRELPLTQTKPGRWEAALRPENGEHEIRVTSRTEHGSAGETVTLRVSPREEAYRRGLDLNMQWFERSGVFPEADGSEGVWSQRCLAWLDGGPEWSLASPFRVDCNAATAQVAYIYGELTGSDVWKQRGLNVARSLLPHQYVDPKQESHGAFPWLYEGVDAVYFWDDNTRIAVALLWLYTRTGEEDLLRAGLRTMELCADVAQADGIIARHVINAAQLDEAGRTAFRRSPPQAVVIDFDLMRWAWAYGVTGDATYGRLLDAAADTWGTLATHRGLPFALRHGDRPALRECLGALWAGSLADSDFQRYGAPLTGPGDYRYAYVNDCSITTEAGEPLTDQLYTTAALLQQALWAHQSTGDPRCLEAFHGLGDFFVRTQFVSDDARLNGAWMRGFDVREWEVYGAPYDPNYGPYSAYTGWMNAFASTALAQYLLGADPLPPKRPVDGRGATILAEIRAERPPSPRPVSIARGAAYTVEPPPGEAYGDAGGELTDGVLDGPYGDGHSVGWLVPEGGELTVVVTVDLGAARTVAGIAQRYGAGTRGYFPDVIDVRTGAARGNLQPAAEVRHGGAGPGRGFIAFPQAVEARYIRIALTKRRVGPGTDFLFVGETEVFEEI